MSFINIYILNYCLNYVGGFSNPKYQAFEPLYINPPATAVGILPTTSPNTNAFSWVALNTKLSELSLKIYKSPLPFED